MAIDKVKSAKIDDKVIEEVKKKAVGGKLPCAAARQMQKSLAFLIEMLVRLLTCST